MTSPNGIASCLSDPPGGVVFRPRRAKVEAYCVVLVFAILQAIVAYLESHTAMDAQIALGFDPTRTAMWVALSIAGTLMCGVFVMLRDYRRLLPAGELRIVASSIVVARGRSRVRHDASELQELSCDRTGADLRLRFSACDVELPGEWLPVG